jgi:hypothetical protein
MSSVRRYASTLVSEMLGAGSTSDAAVPLPNAVFIWRTLLATEDFLSKFVGDQALEQLPDRCV